MSGGAFLWGQKITEASALVCFCLQLTTAMEDSEFQKKTWFSVSMTWSYYSYKKSFDYEAIPYEQPAARSLMSSGLTTISQPKRSNFYKKNSHTYVSPFPD